MQDGNEESRIVSLDTCANFIHMQNINHLCQKTLTDFSKPALVMVFSSKVPTIGNSRTMVKNSDSELSTVICLHNCRKFQIGTFNCSATISCWNFRIVVRGITSHIFCTISVVLQSKVLNENFWQYHYFSLKLSNNGLWDNPPYFLYHFSHTIIKSSDSELSTILMLVIKWLSVALWSKVLNQIFWLLTIIWLFSIRTFIQWSMR